MFQNVLMTSCRQALPLGVSTVYKLCFHLSEVQTAHLRYIYYREEKHVRREQLAALGMCQKKKKQQARFAVRKSKTPTTL